MSTTTVRQILEGKGTEVFFVTPETPVFAALGLMAEKNVGSLLVFKGDQLMGILSERDYARKVVLAGKTSKDTPVKEIMATRVLCVKPEQTVEECMALMTDKRLRHLPVLGEKGVGGVISIGDVVKAVIADQTFALQQLESYISGGR